MRSPREYTQRRGLRIDSKGLITFTSHEDEKHPTEELKVRKKIRWV